MIVRLRDEKDPKTISLIGDSILDNFYMLHDSSKDLKSNIESLGYKVNNYAVEDSRLTNIKGGVIPHEKYMSSRNYPYIVDQDKKMYPLKLLARSSCISNTFRNVYEPLSLTRKNDNSMVVFSIGGHDLQDGIAKIVLGFDYFFNSVVSDNFVSDYESVIAEMLCHSNKILLVSMYLPFLGPGSSYGVFGRFAEPFVNRWRSFLEEKGKKYNIPILDLSRTVNSYNRNHYGIEDIYPSNITSKCISECIDHIYRNYNGFNVYFAPDCDSCNIQTAPR